jgi:hypothetical protein
MKEIKPTVSKTDSVIRLLQEKVCREYQLTQEEVKASTITIKNGEVTVKKGK